MSVRTCPQCAAEVAADAHRCPECGYPVDWQRDPDDATDPTAPHIAPGRPQNAGDGGDTRAVTPPPAVGAPQDRTDPGLSVRCPTCGAVNPAQRTLCERCGMGLVGEHFLDDDRDPVWRGRLMRRLLLAAVVVGGLIAGSALVGALIDSPTGDPRDQTAGGAAATASAIPSAPAVSEPAVVLEPGDTGDEVAQWQRLLAAAGLDAGVDSQFGPNTERLTAQFQRLIGEEPTGRVTTRTLAAAERESSLRAVRIFLLRDDALERVRRRVDRTQLARGALDMLVAAPLQAERDEGLSSAVPSTTRVVGVRVDGGTADVTLTGFATDPDPDSLRQRVDQVVATLTRFDSIDQVRLLLPEADAAVFSDAGVVITGGQGADG